MPRFSKPIDEEFPTPFLYVAGIGQQINTKKADILEVFSAYGEVVDVEFVAGKRFVFVCFNGVMSARLAKEALEDKYNEKLNARIQMKYAMETQLKEKFVEIEDTSSTDTVIIPGLELIESFISEQDEQLILSDIYAGEGSALWRESISRRVQHYGFSFNYRTLMLDYSTKNTLSFPAIYSNLASHIENYQSPPIEGIDSKLQSPLARNSSIKMQPLTQLTLNEYNPGQGIASHIDSESCFGPDIFVVSIGSGYTVSLQRNLESVYGSGQDGTSAVESKTKKHLYLKPRSLLVLRGESRYLWSHMIAPRKNDQVDGELIPRGRRVSLTFRQALIPGDIPPSLLQQTDVEVEHVYRVYDNIALHWNHTRGKRKVHWHRVKEFIENLEPGSLIADVGSGDGKYFGLNPSCLSIGCDRSIKLLEVSRDVRFDSFCCDAVKIPFVSDAFDAVLCIAVLHHLATTDRRVAVLRELLRICRPGGSVMLQAWALEQEATSKRAFEGQDVFVPWRLQKHFQSEESRGALDASTASPEGPCTHVVEENGELVFQRYCHVYKAGELEDMCSTIPGCRIVESGFDRGNWFVQLEKSLDDERIASLSFMGPTVAVPRPHYRNRDLLNR